MKKLYDIMLGYDYDHHTFFIQIRFLFLKRRIYFSEDYIDKILVDYKEFKDDIKLNTNYVKKQK